MQCLYISQQTYFDYVINVTLHGSFSPSLSLAKGFNVRQFNSDSWREISFEILH